MKDDNEKHILQFIYRKSQRMSIVKDVLSNKKMHRVIEMMKRWRLPALGGKMNCFQL